MGLTICGNNVKVHIPPTKYEQLPKHTPNLDDKNDAFVIHDYDKYDHIHEFKDHFLVNFIRYLPHTTYGENIMECRFLNKTILVNPQSICMNSNSEGYGKDYRMSENELNDMISSIKNKPNDHHYVFLCDDNDTEKVYPIMALSKKIVNNPVKQGKNILEVEFMDQTFMIDPKSVVKYWYRRSLYNSSCNASLSNTLQQ